MHLGFRTNSLKKRRNDHGRAPRPPALLRPAGARLGPAGACGDPGGWALDAPPGRAVRAEPGLWVWGSHVPADASFSSEALLVHFFPLNRFL